MGVFDGGLGVSWAGWVYGDVPTLWFVLHCLRLRYPGQAGVQGNRPMGV